MSHHFVRQLIHIMWTTKDQKFVLPDPVRKELYAYISGIVKSHDGCLYLADGCLDHVHCLISLPPTISLSNMMQSIKGSTSKWIKIKPGIDPQFCWQDGYFAISLQEDRKNSVYSYIKNDPERHRNISYKEELAGIMKIQNIEVKEKYLLSTSYTKILLHCIWSTKDRVPLIEKSIQSSMYSEFARVIVENKGIPHAIGGIEDHVHLLMEVPKDKALSDLVKDLKSAASQILLRLNPFFEWQTGFGAFSISFSTLEGVKQYIQNQEEHHKSKSVLNEWNEFLIGKGGVC